MPHVDIYYSNFHYIIAYQNLDTANKISDLLTCFVRCQNFEPSSFIASLIKSNANKIYGTEFKRSFAKDSFDIKVPLL